MNPFRAVREFHDVFGCYTQDKPGVPPGNVLALRLRLLFEELNETEIAMERGDVVKVADGLADLIYVAIGAGLAWGIDLDPVFRLVHESNMRKEGGATRADGKILKPEGWQPPDIAGELELQAERAR